jgi:hypothetical protein
MPFASVELAARVERAECGLIAAAAEAVRRRRPAVEPLVRPLAGGLAVAADAGSPLNKVAGLGFAGPHDVPALDVAELEALERELARRGVPVLVELATLADPSVGALLTRRGYVLMGYEDVLGLDLPSAPRRAPAPDVAVAKSGPEELAAWLDVVVTGFAAPDAEGVAAHEEYPRELLERVLGDMAGADGFRRYLATRAGVAAGAASLRIADGVAQLCGTATLPDQRRRGVQTTLLAWRLAEAAREGADLAVLTAQPGSRSHRNARAQGFELLYSRAVLVSGA